MVKLKGAAKKTDNSTFHVFSTASSKFCGKVRILRHGMKIRMLLNTAGPDDGDDVFVVVVVVIAAVVAAAAFITIPLPPLSKWRSVCVCPPSRDCTLH